MAQGMALEPKTGKEGIHLGGLTNQDKDYYHVEGQPHIGARTQE